MGAYNKISAWMSMNGVSFEEAAEALQKMGELDAAEIAEARERMKAEGYVK